MSPPIHGTARHGATDTWALAVAPRLSLRSRAETEDFDYVPICSTCMCICSAPNTVTQQRYRASVRGSTTTCGSVRLVGAVLCCVVDEHQDMKNTVPQCGV